MADENFLGHLTLNFVQVFVTLKVKRLLACMQAPCDDDILNGTGFGLSVLRHQHVYSVGGSFRGPRHIGGVSLFILLFS